MATILDRGYVVRKRGAKARAGWFSSKRSFTANFPEIIDYDFTAKIENELDDIADGSRKWTEVVANTYLPLENKLPPRPIKLSE